MIVLEHVGQLPPEDYRRLLATTAGSTARTGDLCLWCGTLDVRSADRRLGAVVREQPFPLLFVTISGAHLYGFPSPDSDYDLRGVHLLPLADVAGLRSGRETIEVSDVREGLEIDLVSHDARKFFGLLLKKNGYVLEQIFSPLVLQTTPEHEELKRIAAGCITRGARLPVVQMSWETPAGTPISRWASPVPLPVRARVPSPTGSTKAA